LNPLIFNLIRIYLQKSQNKTKTVDYFIPLFEHYHDLIAQLNSLSNPKDYIADYNDLIEQLYQCELALITILEMMIEEQV
jgi:hypothetical protein